MKKKRVYVCIDLKSFYASVECRERHLDPMTANLVVADPERTEKTICLAVSPAMKARRAAPTTMTIRGPLLRIFPNVAIFFCLFFFCFVFIRVGRCGYLPHFGGRSY